MSSLSFVYAYKFKYKCIYFDCKVTLYWKVSFRSKVGVLGIIIRGHSFKSTERYDFGLVLFLTYEEAKETNEY